MVRLVNGKSYYRLLLKRLNETDFTYSIPMDSNRAEDGINLRYRFGRECGYADYEIANSLDIKPCSVLEMMVALAIRCEHVMYDPENGDRTDAWFWDMINNLGLTGMVNNKINMYYVDEVIDALLERRYERNGEGGLFVVDHNGRDLRSVEIWYQMNWYLDDIINA
jgi:hypothetical protein